jgi:hypothetical protein
MITEIEDGELWELVEVLHDLDAIVAWVGQGLLRLRVCRALRVERLSILAMELWP